jgi:hypothetical protein
MLNPTSDSSGSHGRVHGLFRPLNFETFSSRFHFPGAEGGLVVFRTVVVLYGPVEVDGAF